MHLRFSQAIQSLLEQLSVQPLTLKDVLLKTSEQGFGLVIGLLVLPFLFPMPPGFTGILGTACLILSLQMAIGRRSPWLPPAVARFQFPHAITLQLLKHLNRVSHYLSKITRPRWQRIARNPSVWRLNGICISWLALLLMAPIPFTNPIPTIGILLFVIAMLESDGLLLCIAYGLTGLITAFFGSILFLLWQSSDWLRSVL